MSPKHKLGPQDQRKSTRSRAGRHILASQGSPQQESLVLNGLPAHHRHHAEVSVVRQVARLLLDLRSGGGGGGNVCAVYVRGVCAWMSDGWVGGWSVCVGGGVGVMFVCARACVCMCVLASEREAPYVLG